MALNPASSCLIPVISDLAQKNVAFLSLLENSTTNDPNPTSGIACLENSKKNLEKGLVDSLNILTQAETALKTHLAQKGNILKESQKNLENLGKIRSGGFSSLEEAKQLIGGAPVPSTCQVIYKEEDFVSGGFVGLLNKGAEINQKSIQYTNSLPVLEKNFSDLKSRIARAMQTNLSPDSLVSEVQSSGLSSTSVKAALEELMKNKVTPEYEQIKKDLMAAGYSSVPNLQDSRFEEEFQKMARADQLGASKNYALQNCLQGKQGSGLAITPSQMINSVRSSKNDSVGVNSSLESYKTELKNIFENDKNWTPETIKKLEELNSRYDGQFVLDLTDKKGIRRTASPGQVLSESFKACEQRYALNQEIDKNNSGGYDSSKISAEEKAQRATAALGRLRQLKNSLSMELGQVLQKKIVNCNDFKPSEATCAEAKVFETGAEGFCFAAATLCAQKNKECRAAITQKSMAVTQQIQAAVNGYNQQVKEFQDTQEAYLKEILQKVAQKSQEFFAVFKTSFKVPKDMAMPVLSFKEDAKLNARVMEGFDLDGKTLGEKLQLLKGALEEQGAENKKEYEKHLDKQKKAIAENKQLWSKLISECGTEQGNLQKAMQGQQAEKTKQEAAAKKTLEGLQKKISLFCTKWKIQRGACDGGVEKIVEEFAQIKEYLSNAGKIEKELETKQKACGKQGKKKEDDITEENILARMCPLYKNNEGINKHFKILNNKTDWCITTSNTRHGKDLYGIYAAQKKEEKAPAYNIGEQMPECKFVPKGKQREAASVMSDIVKQLNLGTTTR